MKVEKSALEKLQDAINLDPMSLLGRDIDKELNEDTPTVEEARENEDYKDFEAIDYTADIGYDH